MESHSEFNLVAPWLWEESLESPPPTALAVQFVIVQYSSKIPLSLFALSDSVHLYSSSNGACIIV
ncbi:hypothetical protein DVH24_032585 [Malus domestica]|uniref:Uncharacterized protein n=1 Tax=Malus domestica TaxID=3750 RepID=A0A498J3R0_MALDO|nr:hypothetical protein DVH24_032585 [Malus domestica]